MGERVIEWFASRVVEYMKRGREDKAYSLTVELAHSAKARLSTLDLGDGTFYKTAEAARAAYRS